MIIRFPVVFRDLQASEVESRFVGRIDPSLKQLGKERLPVFLKWLVGVAIDWYEHRHLGANAPSAVQEAKKEYLNENDTLTISDCRMQSRSKPESHHEGSVKILQQISRQGNHCKGLGKAHRAQGLQWCR